MLENGWVLPESSHAPGPFPGKRYLHEVYTMADPRFTGRVTVPLLWDVRRGTIANNESGDILRAFGGAWSQTGVNLYPQALSDEIDLMNARVYEDINNGVYKCGFATTQQAYDRAAKALFRAMDALEKHLSGRTYLVGEVLTEADIRLFTTMIRFDVVYHVHFKCCRKRLVDYPALLRHTARLFERPDIRQTVSIAAIRRHYFYSHKDINPHRIVPLAPANGVGLS